MLALLLEMQGDPLYAKVLTIATVIDFIHSILGEYQTSQIHSQIQRPNFIINHADGTKSQVISDVPDLVFLQGTLVASSLVAEGASLAATWRSGPPFPGTKPIVWTINGESGEIRVTSPIGATIQAGIDKPSEVKIEVHDHATNSVKEVEWTWEPEWQADLSPRGRNVGGLYELYAQGPEAVRKAGVADFEDAVARHAQIDKLLW